MAKLTTIDVTSGYASTTALNNNFALIETALENTLSRDGTSPNSMSADLDMNSHGILNVTSLIVNGVDIASLSTSATAAAASAAAALSSEANALASEVAAELAAVQVVNWDYLGAWTTTTVYAVNNIVYESTNGASYICLVAHTAGTFATDLGAGKWGLLATRGSAGAGTGDMLKSENLSGLANYTTARSNLGLSIGVDVQAYDVELVAIAGLTSAANKIPYWTGIGTAANLDFNPSTALSASTTTLPSQTVVKTAVDDLIANCSTATPDTTVDYFIFEDATDTTQKKALLSSLTGGAKTTIAATSGTYLDFTGIPAGSKKVIVMFSNVSTSGGALVRVQLGDSGGIETTGYSSSSSFIGSSVSSVASTGGFDIQAADASALRGGSIIFTLLDAPTFTWVAQGVFATAAGCHILGGTKATSSELTQIRITTSNGTDTFDSGSVNILYE